MKTTLLWSLVVLNALLLASFLSTLTGREVAGGGVAMAQAQPAPGAAGGNAARPRPGEYIMIPGEVTGGSSSVVYLIDAANRQLGALAYDDTQKQLNVMPPIPLDRVFDAAGAAPTNKGSGNTNTTPGNTRRTTTPNKRGNN